jgi:hypothetical protein
MAADQYEEPEVSDYGTLEAVTEAVVRFGGEDGASKFDTVNHHSLPSVP